MTLLSSPCFQLTLNNSQLTQILKSSVPVVAEEEDPLQYYEKHTAQIEVGMGTRVGTLGQVVGAEEVVCLKCPF